MNKEFITILNNINEEIFLHPNSNLIEENIVNSLDVMQIVAALEETYQVDFDPEDILPENFASAEAIWILLQKNLKEKENA